MTRNPTPGGLPAASPAFSGKKIGAREMALLAVVAYAVVTGSFIWSNPPGASPDEVAHYVKALAVGRGGFILKTEHPPLPPNAAVSKRIRWLILQTRMATIPASLSPQPFECWSHPFYVGRCGTAPPSGGGVVTIGTHVGRYPPYSYLVPGALMRAAANPTSALYLGRVGVGLTSLLLISLAAFALSDGRPVSLVGLLSAMTPMTLYLMASLSGNGVEIAAGVAFLACLLRLTRRSPPPPKWLWMAVPASGGVLLLTRDLGFLWLLVDLSIVLLLVGVRRAVKSWTEGGRRAVGAAVVVGVAVALTGAWQLTQSARPPMGPRLISALDDRLDIQSDIYRQTIGVFGPLDAPMPRPAYWLAGLTVAALVLLALVRGTRRQRITLALTIVAVFIVTLAVDAAQAAAGFGAQGRHLMPVAVAIPLVAGEILTRGSAASKITDLAPKIVAGAYAVLQVAGWYTVAHRFSVGNAGPRRFWLDPQWTPPAGWLPWAGLAVVGALLVAAIGAGVVHTGLGERDYKARP